MSRKLGEQQKYSFWRDAWKKLAAIISISYLTTVCFGQVADDFSDGDFSTNPSWSGNTSQFTVNAAQELQLNNSAAGHSYLTTALRLSALAQMEWQFFIRQSFAPSGSNNSRVYLVSDQADLTQPLNGYYLQFGEAGSNDAIELFRQEGSVSTSVCRASNGKIAAAFALRIKVARDTAGMWQLNLDYAGGTDFSPEASGPDTVITQSSFFGVLCNYTVSNATKFYFDDFYAGSKKTESPPPATTANYKDIIFTEIFPDPSPQIGLPDQEYLEIFNRSTVTLDLFGWTLSDGTSVGTFGRQPIAPNEYWIVCASTNVNLFSGYGKVIGVSPLPTLNNDGDHLMLRDATGNMIDSVSYNSQWYHDVDKQDGGWSLEIIDVNNNCGEGDNWTASEDPAGGTPGKQNSVFANKPDLTGPELIEGVCSSSSLIVLYFNEKLERDISEAQFEISPAKGISKKYFSNALLTQVTLVLSDSLERRKMYSITVSNIADCSGNAIQSDHNQTSVALVEDADSLDIVINEILFNPRSGGADFIEVYNNSPKFINLKGWKVGNFENHALTNTRNITTDDLVLPPSAYAAFTPDPATLLLQHPQAIENRVYEVDLPSLPDDEGSVAVASGQNLVIDHFQYSEKMHSPFIKDNEGVSLERVSFSTSTGDAGNWNSASATSGFATPGFVNSNARRDSPQQAGTVELDPVVFSPSVSGRDFSKINYRFDRGGNVATVKVLDSEGRQVKSLTNNQTLDTSGFLRWDGDRDDGTRARMGYYVVWFEVFDTNGTVNIYRKRVVVGK